MTFSEERSFVPDLPPSAPPLPEREKTPWLAAACALIVPLIPTPAVLPGPLRGHGSPARMLGYLCLALVVVGFVLARRNSAARSRNPGTMIIVAYFFLLLLTYGTGLLDPKNAVIEASKTRTMLVMCAHVGVALYVMKSVRTSRQRSIVVGCLVAGLSYACVVALLQAFSGVDLRELLVPPGFTQSLEDIDFSSREGSRRVFGTSQHAIELSVLAVVGVVLSLHLARYAIKPLHRQLSATACALAIVAIPIAISRSGVVALAAALLVYMFAWNLRALANAVLVGLIVLGIYRLVLPNYVQALWYSIIYAQRDTSISTRTEDYAVVGQHLRENPWFGLGLGGYPPTEYRYLDNEWLQAIVQGGLVGVVALMLLFGSIAVAMTAALRRVASVADRNLVYALSAALVGIASSSFTFDLRSFQQITLVFFLLYGLLWSFASVPNSTARA